MALKEGDDMENENLQATLGKLRADLANTSTMDPGMRDSLHLLEQDIQNRLDLQQRMEAESAAEQEEGLAERTREISARFAAQHPRLEPVLRELGAILQRMGI
jgi:hypothetical protein